jgi:hypothetical protein
MVNMTSIPVAGVLAKLLVARWVALSGRTTVVRSRSSIPDTLTASMIPSFSRLGARDRVLAEVEQDGFLFATNPLDVCFFNRRAQKKPRHRSRVEVVLRQGVVMFRKQHLLSPGGGLKEWVSTRLGIRFYTEVAALLRLQGLSFVPQLHAVDWHRRALFLDYIHGENLRHRLALNGKIIFHGDLNVDPILSRLSDRARVDREFALWSVSPDSAALRPRLKAAFAMMHTRGVTYDDIHLANIILGSVTGEPYWVDFEMAKLNVRRCGPRSSTEVHLRFCEAFGDPHRAKNDSSASRSIPQ